MSENDSHTSDEHVPQSSSPRQVDSIGARNWWCDTRQMEAHFSYVWNIYDLESYPEEVGEIIESSTFSSDESCNLKLCLHLYPGGNTKDDIDFVSLYLHLVSSDKDEVRIKYKFMILDNKQIETNEHASLPCKFDMADGREWGFEKFIRRADLLDPLKGFLSDGNLMILCEGSVMMDRMHISGQSNQFKFPACRLTDNFNTLLESEKFSDVTLVSGGGSDLRAHKAILSAQSRVFAAMFEHEMMEHEQNCVNITDVDYETLKEMIRFMYAGRVFNLGNIAGKLLVAADKYALERLKVMCEESLLNSISIETAAEILILADMHSAEQLKARTIDFIVNRSHATEVMKTSGWKNVVPTLPHLVTEMFLALAAQQKNLPTVPK